MPDLKDRGVEVVSERDDRGKPGVDFRQGFVVIDWSLSSADERGVEVGTSETRHRRTSCYLLMITYLADPDLDFLAYA